MVEKDDTREFTLPGLLGGNGALPRFLSDFAYAYGADLIPRDL
jgi:hypothetical protein